MHYKCAQLALSLDAKLVYCDTDSWIIAFRRARGGYKAFCDARTADFPRGPVDQAGSYLLLKDEVPEHDIRGVVVTCEKFYALDLRNHDGSKVVDEDGVEVPYCKVAAVPLAQGKGNESNESKLGYGAQRRLKLGEQASISVARQGFKRRRLSVTRYETDVEVGCEKPNQQKRRTTPLQCEGGARFMCKRPWGLEFKASQRLQAAWRGSHVRSVTSP